MWPEKWCRNSFREYVCSILANILVLVQTLLIMAQLTLYLNDEAHALVLAAAKREGTSLSKWAGKHLVAAAKPDTDTLPASFFDLFGSIDDESFEEPRELDSTADGKLDTL